MGDKVKIVGVRKVNFTDKQTGNTVSGVTYFFTFKQDGVDGVAADKVFIHQDRLVDLSYLPSPGDEVILLWNRYGKLADVQKI